MELDGVEQDAGIAAGVEHGLAARAVADLDLDVGGAAARAVAGLEAEGLGGGGEREADAGGLHVA